MSHTVHDDHYVTQVTFKDGYGLVKPGFGQITGKSGGLCSKLLLHLRPDRKEVVDACYKKQISKKAKIKMLDKKLLQIDAKMKELKGGKKQIALCKFNSENEVD